MGRSLAGRRFTTPQVGARRRPSLPPMRIRDRTPRPGHCDGPNLALVEAETFRRGRTRRTFAVGDWVLGPRRPLLVRRLERRMQLQRQAEGRRPSAVLLQTLTRFLIDHFCNDDLKFRHDWAVSALATRGGQKKGGGFRWIVLTPDDQTSDPTLRQQGRKRFKSGGCRQLNAKTRCALIWRVGADGSDRRSCRIVWGLGKRPC